MKIYSVTESFGIYEDYSVYRRLVTTDLKVAEKVRDYLQTEEDKYAEQADKCENCIYGCGEEPPCDCLKLVIEDEEDDEDEEICRNYISKHFISEFHIEEEEICDSYEEWVKKYEK